MISVKVITVGDSIGIELPKELLEHLQLGAGDTLSVLETPNGLELQPYDEEYTKQIEFAEGVMKNRRNVLRRLAE